MLFRSERRTYIARGGSLVQLPDSMRMMVPTDLDAAMASPFFTESARHAFIAEPSRAAELRETALLHRGTDADESIAAFVRRHFGDEVVETVARPLLAGVFGGDIDKLSARALLAPFLALEAHHGSLISGLQSRQHAAMAPVFTTLACGLGTLVDRLSQTLPPGSLRLSNPVLAINSRSGGWAVETANGYESFDRVLLATPLDITRKLLGSIPLAESQQAAALLPTDATSGLVVALGYGAQATPAPAIPNGFGFLVTASPATRHSLLACTFLHQKFPGRAPEGGTLLRSFFASSGADELSHRSDDEIADVARDQLIRFLGPLPQHADVTIVRRWPRSLPQYEVGHVGRIAQFNGWFSKLHGLMIAGNALQGVGLPDLVRDATQAAQVLARD